MLRLAWRNLWRNRRRTALTLATVAIATTVLTLISALMRGMTDGAVRNATETVTGEVQIHAPGYTAERSFYDAISESDAVLAALAAASLPAAPRAYGYGLAARDNKSAGAFFWGVDPSAEARAFALEDWVREGAFLGAEAGGSALLGHKLARSLGAAIGDEIVVVVEAADGSIGNELLHVGGILGGLGESVDRSAVLVHRADFARLFVSEGRVHEIVVNTRGSMPVDELARTASEAAPGLEVRTWREVLPMLSDMLNVMDGALWLFSSVFLLAAGLGVLNTMLMATYERTREIGILKALGTPPWRLACDVALEALLLAVAAGAIGGLAGTAASLALERYGIDTASLAGSIDFGGVVFDPVWRAAYSWTDAVEPALVLCVVCVLAALYPAVSAARLRAVDAIARR